MLSDRRVKGEGRLALICEKLPSLNAELSAIEWKCFKCQRRGRVNDKTSALKRDVRVWRTVTQVEDNIWLKFHNDLHLITGGCTSLLYKLEDIAKGISYSLIKPPFTDLEQLSVFVLQQEISDNLI